MAEQTIPFQTGDSETCLKIERRAWIRFAREQDITCQPVTPLSTQPASTAWMGRVRDVSPVGIGLSMSRRFEPGSALIVELATGPDGVLGLPARVVHATLEKNGRWIIGCAFATPLSQVELQRLFEV
jgi:PilZ domain